MVYAATPTCEAYRTKTQSPSIASSLWDHLRPSKPGRTSSRRSLVTSRSASSFWWGADIGSYRSPSWNQRQFAIDRAYAHHLSKHLPTWKKEFRTFLIRVASRTMVVLDEAHYSRARTALGSGGFAARPTSPSASGPHGNASPNGYEDLTNLFRFIYPTRNIIGFPRLPSGNDCRFDATAIPELKTKIAPFYTRIRKERSFPARSRGNGA